MFDTSKEPPLKMYIGNEIVFFENIDIWGFGSYELKSRYRKVSIMEIFGDFCHFLPLGSIKEGIWQRRYIHLVAAPLPNGSATGSLHPFSKYDQKLTMDPIP